MKQIISLFFVLLFGCYIAAPAMASATDLATYMTSGVAEEEEKKECAEDGPLEVAPRIFLLSRASTSHQPIIPPAPHLSVPQPPPNSLLL